ncbi:MAG: site-specific integrase [Rikenellaceae bacterium]|jgi:integrase|nr:site-specific integrase [Rikenellaceae bacterium]
MATTYKAVVYKDDKRKDGTYNVKIRLTHNRQSLRLSTTIYVGADDLTRGLKIKTQDYIDQTDDLIKSWRKITNTLGASADLMDVKQVHRYILNYGKGTEAFKLDFIAYGRELVKSMSETTGKTYTSALNCLERFTGGMPLDISTITAKFLESFEVFIRTEPTMRYSPKHGIIASNTPKEGRAISSYLSCIRYIHNQAKREHNDEDLGVIRIPQSPFKKYAVKKAPKSKKKALPTKQIQAIISLPDQDRVFGWAEAFTRRDLARDCFLLSFGLAGMNAADLYDCEAQVLDEKEPVIVYKRMKTRTRREDEAEMHIRVEPCILPLVKKYFDSSGERLFCFHKHYSSLVGFNNAIGEGLEQAEKAIKSKTHFTFYAARHSYATISRSKALNIDKHTVHEGLNHVDPKMKITDDYIDRDYGNIWDANAKLLALFDWSEIDKISARQFLEK